MPRPLTPFFALSLALSAAGCDSAALNLDFPDVSEIELQPQFMQTESQEVVLTFADFDPANAEGSAGERGVVAWEAVALDDLDGDGILEPLEDGEEGLSLETYEFQSNFRLRLFLAKRFDGVREGEYEMRVTIRNHYGTLRDSLDQAGCTLGWCAHA